MTYTELPITQNEIVLCYKCKHFVYLIATIKSTRGRRIPLDNYAEKIAHVCAGALA